MGCTYTFDNFCVLLQIPSISSNFPMAIVTRRLLQASAMKHLVAPDLLASHPEASLRSQLGTPVAIPQHFSYTAPQSQRLNTCVVTLESGKWELMDRCPPPLPFWGNSSKMYYIKLLRQSCIKYLVTSSGYHPNDAFWMDSLSCPGQFPCHSHLYARITFLNKPLSHLPYLTLCFEGNPQ